MRACKINNCQNLHYSKGFCKVHYDKNRRHGDPNFIRKIVKNTPCSIQECKGLIFANNLCSMHNRRLQRHGDPLYINPRCNRDGKYKERFKGYYKKWLNDNWAEQMAYRQARKKRVRQATPTWADIKDIIEFYKNCPKGYHVDHIIPIHGKIVSGLHVINNLQYLKAEDNLKKGNKYG